MNKASPRLPDDYAALLAEVKARVRSAQLSALKAVNKELVTLCWDIGRLIVNRQADADHGTAIVEQLAADLRRELPGVSGYSRRNIFYMREFYLAYHGLPKVQPLVAQIGWSHNLAILRWTPSSPEQGSSATQPSWRPRRPPTKTTKPASASK